MQFTITESHLKLLRHFSIIWDDSESGGPAVDPKRPYGNSNVAYDIHRILTGETIGRVDSVRDSLSDTEDSRYYKLHEETKTALQICLILGEFKTGTFEREGYHYGRWTEVR